MPKAQSSGSRRFFKNPNFLKKYLDYMRVLCYYNICSYAGVVQWLESQPSKLVVWVRFPSPAPVNGYCDPAGYHKAGCSEIAG